MRDTAKTLTINLLMEELPLCLDLLKPFVYYPTSIFLFRSKPNEFLFFVEQMETMMFSGVALFRLFQSRSAAYRATPPRNMIGQNKFEARL